MPQMKPNSAIVEARVTHIETYSRQDDFNILSLDVKKALPKEDEGFMFDKEKDACIKALVSKEAAETAHLKDNIVITVELKKVSIDLWRIIKFV